MKLTRRHFGKLSAATMAFGVVGNWASLSLASNPVETPLHGLSAFGDLGNSPDDPHFSFVNPDAPKGGAFNFAVPNWLYNQNPQTFDTLNTYILKGNAPPRMELCFSSLMIASIDEPTTVYGAVAETVTISEDRNTYTFKLRPQARFHDGSSLTAHDVAYSYLTLKKDGHPEIALNLTHLTDAIAIDDHTVKLVFNGKQSDRSILVNAVLPIFSKSYYKDRSFAESTMDPPLGSGAYKVKRASPGKFIEFERVPDYWAADLPFARGRNNFDVLRIEFYRERQAAFEAFKKGEIHLRQEFVSKTWATEYDFPAVVDGRVKKQLFPDEKLPSFQAWACNKRRSKFADPRTVEAIAHCFDFEWTNKNLFYGVYSRGQSFFEGSDFVATGRPDEAERALLQSLKSEVDPSVFEEAPLQPVSNGSGRDRRLLRKANDLLKQAGWKRSGSQLLDKDGNPLTVEFLIRSPTFERILGSFITNLKAVGVGASIRLVDPAQFQKRLDTYDFDICGMAFRFDATPSLESMEQFFGSKNADLEGNRNFAGIRNDAVDELIAKIDGASSRAELTIILRALDRVLRSTHSWIPNWTSANHRIAYWDMFGFPETKPDYSFPVETFWWFDEEKARAIGKG